MAITLLGKNKACKRESLHLKWRLNRGNFQQLVKDMTKGNIRVRKSVDYSDITMLAVGHISPRLHSASFYHNNSELSICTFSDYDFRADSLERQIMNDKLLALWASGCEEPEFYHLVSSIASSPYRSKQFAFWTYLNCDIIVWLDAFKFFSIECPCTSGEYILLNEELYKESARFSKSIMDTFHSVRLVKREASL